MTILNAHFDGKQIVLNKPAPRRLSKARRIRVLIDEELPKSSSLAAVAKLAVKGKLPPDFARQHEHYSKGSPRR